MAKKRDRTIADLYRPDSPVGTEFLRLYHNLVRGATPQEARSYLITSATIGEGKSTVAAFLALTMATVHKKTLLVDADLRRPAIHKLFNLYLEEGLTEVGDGTAQLSKVYKETSNPFLSVLTAGRLSRNPSAYFEDGQVTRVLTAARARFDFIVLDCAPVMPVVDPVVVAPHVSGVLLVVKAGETHRELVKEATAVLDKAGAPIKGVLLNNVKQVLPYHYKYRYAYQYYRSSVNGDRPDESG